MSWRQDAEMLLAWRAFARELGKIRRHRAWWALNDPVAYVWLCRAERRGAVVPWSG